MKRFASWLIALLFASSIVAAQSREIVIDVAKLSEQIASQELAARQANQYLSATISLPWIDGVEATFDLHEASQFEPGLQAKYPDIRSFRVSPTGSNEIIGRFNLSPYGVYLIVLTENDPVEIQHAQLLGESMHTIRRVSMLEELERFSCGVDEPQIDRSKHQHEQQRANNCFQLGATLRRYRIALTNTGEFANLNGGTLAGVNTAFNNRLAQLNAIFEKEASITFALIAGNDVLVQLNPSTDPITNPSNTSTSLTETENFIESQINNSDYDIGHGLHAETSGSIAGFAGVGVVCGTGIKARAYSTIFNNSSLVIFQHEVGHQFGCLHTNYGCGNTGQQRFEPGMGVTIMGTSAGCSAGDQYDARNNLYFHVGSLKTIRDYVAAGGNCFTGVATANLAPTADANAAVSYTIPANTAFVLEGVGSDPNGGSLSYSWEQLDTDLATTALPTATASITTAPLFRSFAPGSSPVRYFPRLSTILAGTVPNGADGEILPAVSRSMTFAFTVRDGLNGIACDERSVSVVNTGAAFLVTSQNTPTSWVANGSNTATVTWNVAGTTGGGINASNVDILLSTDGGQTFTYAIASATTNDGTHTFIIPSFPTALGRVMVRGTGNIFLDINNANIDISSSSSCAAAQAAIAPMTAVSAAEGSPTLNLSLSPTFGTPLTSPIIINISGASPSGTLVGKDPGGACLASILGADTTQWALQ